MRALFLALSFLVTGVIAQTRIGNTQELDKQIPPPNAKVASAHSDLPSEFEHLLTRYSFENDGTGRKDVIAKIRVLNEMGILQQSESTFAYRPYEEELKIFYFRVRKMNGSIVNVETDAVQRLAGRTSEVVAQEFDYDERRVRVPGLAPGDLIEYEVVTWIHRPIGPGEFFVLHNFEPSVVLDEQLEVDVPAERGVKLKCRPDLKFWKTAEGGRKVYHWEDQSLKTTQAIAIPYIPGRTPDVQLSSFLSWEEVGRWYSNLEKDHRVPTVEVKAKADELTKSSKNDLERVEALYNFAAKRIKYISLVSFGIGGSEPRSALETLHNAYGDCKDKTALLEALLEAEGMHASSVLISGDRELDLDMPSPWPFDHVIAMLEIGKDKIWLDPSSAVLPFNMLAYPLRGKQALLVSSDGVPHLEKTPVETPVQNTWSEQIEGEVAENGTLDATVKITARGDAELPLRQTFLLLAESMRPRGVRGAVMGIERSDQVTDVKISDPTATDGPFILAFRLSKPIFVPLSKKQFGIKLPLSDCRIDAFGGYPMTGWDNGGSRNVRLGPPRECNYKIRIELPPKFKTALPTAIALHNDYASYKANYEIEGNTLTAGRNLNTYKDELPSSLATDYEAFCQQLLTDSGVVIRLADSVPTS